MQLINLLTLAVKFLSIFLTISTNTDPGPPPAAGATPSATTQPAASPAPNLDDKIVKAVDVREMLFTAMFQKLTTFVTSQANHIIKIELTVGNKSITAPFASNGKVGRVDIQMHDIFEENEIFTEKFDLQLRIINEWSQDDSIMFFKKEIKTNPNIDYEYKFSRTNFLYNFTIRTTCSTAWVSVNCGTKMLNSKPENFELNKYTGEVNCQDINVNCLESPRCGESPTISCGDKGDCFKDLEDNSFEYCVCKEGYSGKLCDVPPSVLAEEILLFGSLEDVVPIETAAHNDCDNKKSQTYNNFVVCDEKKTIECTGEDKCTTICGENICRFLKNQEQPNYYKRPQEA